MSITPLSRGLHCCCNWTHCTAVANWSNSRFSDVKKQCNSITMV